MCETGDAFCHLDASGQQQPLCSRYSTCSNGQGTAVNPQDCLCGNERKECTGGDYPAKVGRVCYAADSLCSHIVDSSVVEIAYPSLNNCEAQGATAILDVNTCKRAFGGGGVDVFADAVNCPVMLISDTEPMSHSGECPYGCSKYFTTYEYLNKKPTSQPTRMKRRATTARLTLKGFCCFFSADRQPTDSLPTAPTLASPAMLFKLLLFQP